MPMTDEEVFEKVKDVLVEALAVDDDEVSPDAKLAADLGAESIDFLDITFHLEKAFGISIPRGELVPDNLANNPDYVNDGKLTEAGLAKMKESMPHVDFSEFEQDPDINKILDLFTVDTVCKYVASKVNGG
jgi:acyl carrier protein